MAHSTDRLLAWRSESGNLRADKIILTGILCGEFVCVGWGTLLTLCSFIGYKSANGFVV